MHKSGRIHQINTSGGGVPKLSVAEAEVTVDGVAGDRQATPGIHGGPERAVCLYSWEVIQELQREGHPISPGSAGENVTLSGLDWRAAQPGVRLNLGDEVQLEVTRFTAPCKTIAGSFLERDYGRISERAHPGWSRVYAKVIRGGKIKAGDRAWFSEGQT